MTQPQRREVCPVCGLYPDVGRFCLKCGTLNSHPHSGDRAAPYRYRLAAELLDLLIFALGVLPWLVWMWHTANDGQSPGKRLLGMYVLAEDGQAITPQRMWMRELAIKRLLFGLLGYLFTGIPTLVDGGWMLLNPDRPVRARPDRGHAGRAAPRAGHCARRGGGDGWTRTPS